MGMVLNAGRGLDDSRPDYEEAMALTRRLREQRILGGTPGARGGSLRPKARAREGNVLSQGLGWGIGLGLGFWACIALACRQLL